jgi:hypothetical protein
VKLLGRTTRPEDLDQCLAIVRDGFLYDDAARADLRSLWLELITRDTGRSAVVFEANDPGRVLVFGVSAAIDARRFEAILAEREPFVARALLEQWRSGKNPFLDNGTFASANSGDGLYFCVLNNGVSEQLDAADLPAALSALSGEFVIQHAGCNLSGLVHEAFGVPREFATDLGVTITDHAPVYASRVAALPKDRVPAFIISMTRDEAKLRQGNLALNQIFLRFTPPRCALPTHGRRLLRYALEGTPDERIAEILNFAPSTLKKRWAEVYAAMEPVTGIAPGLGNGQRGTEIRRHVLRYVREHPEELHAYAAGATEPLVQQRAT